MSVHSFLPTCGAERRMRVNLRHAQITYQLWNEGRSKPSPRWFERLPNT